MGSPIQLQCLCHKAVETTATATAGVIKAKIACNGAAVKSSLVASASISSPDTDKPKILPRRGVLANILAVAELKAKLNATLALSSTEVQLPIELDYSNCIGEGPLYTITVSGFSQDERLDDSLVGTIAKIPHVDTQNNLKSTYSYRVVDIDEDQITLIYVSDTAGLGETSPCTLCSEYSITIIDSYGYGYGYGDGQSGSCKSQKIRFDLDAITLRGVGDIEAGLTANYKPKQSLESEATLDTGYTDKVAGDFEAACVQKLYPIKDIDIGEFLAGSGLSSVNLYGDIDEGVFSSDYYKHNGGGELLSDDINSYIQPSAVHTEGTFSFKCELTKPIVTVKDTRVRFRAAAPLSNWEAGVAPEYKIHNIKFEDPSGNLITHYNDIEFRGDADYNNPPIVNFANYSSSPKTNMGALYEWQPGYPILDEASGYTLSFNVTVTDISDPFNPGFDFGFEENYEINGSGHEGPNNSLRISAVEICNSGRLGPASENYINIYYQVPATGNRIERRIRPIGMPLYGQESDVYPAVSSIWYGSGDPSISNENKTGASKNVEFLNSDYPTHYITLDSTGPIADSGKLTLEFGHKPVGSVYDVTKGGFSSDFDQAIGCHNVSGAFNTLNKNPFDSPDHFFEVECVFLRVLAKKAVGSRDYAIDVVGYSDDKILNVTKQIGGFLQNTSGDGTIPLTSGFNPVDELGVSAETLSDADQYYRSSGTNNAGGDHYLLSPDVVTTTEFKWHEIPLEVYEDTVTLGVSPNYNSSSKFEHLFFDIFPIPSGASIADIELIVRYRPQSAVNLSTQGGESLSTLEPGRSESKIYPSSRQSSDDIINAGSGYAPLSTIEGIPQGYGTPTTIKSNYSRRWRGHTGLANGPFDPDMFGFGYENPLLDFPFLSGYYDFTTDHGTDIIPRQGTLSGVLNTTYSDYRFQNLGWRFTDNTLFSDQLPGYSGDYQTTDWTALSSGVDNFESHPLYGQIADAFDTVVRTSGHNSYIDFGDVDVTDEFSLYVRFSPDANVSGVGYDLFESGVLVSKWDSASNLEFALAYSGGYLQGLAKDTGGTVHDVTDSTHYTNYQFPLSVILTYNDHDSSGLKLYTDNEFENDWTTLRASSVADFDLANGSSTLKVGHSPGSGVGFNMFVSEFGLSDRANVVYENADLTLKQVTAQSFLENIRVKWWDESDSYTDDSYKLWDYVNEDSATGWHLGDFKYAEFNQAFDRWTKRTGRDLISFKVDHHGSGYSQSNDITLPTNVDNNLAYHTQVENDFLRFNLSDAVDSFHSTNRRITKNLPRGYTFAEEALVVDTIIQHEGSESIVWEDGKIGPKLIVSLYTKNQDPYWTPDQPNWGLINRYHHYLTPSSYMTKLKSIFDYDSLIDESEEWAKFPTEPRQKEFKEKYFSQDINDMFVQYDVAYPSGSPFNSRIDIHTTHIRLEDAYVTGVDVSGSMDLAVSGNPSPITEFLNLHTVDYHDSSGQLNLYTVGPIRIDNSGLPIFTSGLLVSAEDLGMFTEGHQSINITVPSGLTLSTSGSPAPTIYDASGSVNLNTFGKGIITSSGNGHLGMSLTAINTDISYIPSGSPLSLFTHGHTGVDVSAFAAMPLFTNIDRSHGTAAQRTGAKPSGSLSLHMIASQALFSRYPNGSMNLFTFSNQPSGSLNLTLYGDNYEPHTLSEQVNLFTANYDVTGTGANYVRWFNRNYGTNIDLEDNDYASVPVDDNIRGVDIVGYGACDSDSPEKAIDPAIVTHDTVWRPETCNDGGIFRATNTYTSGSWSGNYYDIRKYTGLVPNAAYNAELKISTGSTESIKLPNEWEEWEYGTNEDINFSGIKLVGDDPYIDVSGRNPEDHYGKAVAVQKDLMAVGAPDQTVANEEGSGLSNAGAVYLYRRNADVAGQKAAWAAEQKLVLPSGFRGNYFENLPGEIVSFPGIGSISGRQWYPGQEGREFGHSVDVASSGGKELVVVGAPGGDFSTEFDTVTTSGIPVGMMVFVDKFSPGQGTSSIENTASKWDILYKYFSAPWNAGGDEFQPELDIQLLVFEVVNKDKEDRPKINFKQDWIHHDYVNKIINEDADDINNMVSGIKILFNKAFQHNTDKIHNNIPPIIGIFQDDSLSLNGKNYTTDATKSAVDAFVDYYGSYSYQSGVVDPGGPIAASGYTERTQGIAEDWVAASVGLLNHTLSTGNLIDNDALKFITSGVGLEWAKTSLTEFNKKPMYTGRTYIFEKEDDQFNLIQEIEAEYQPTFDAEFGFTSNPKSTIDRFGHSVSISENTEVVTIGSPFARSENCTIYERSDTEEKKLFGGLKGWLTYYGLTSELEDLEQQTETHGVASGQRIAYNNLSEHNRWKFRSDNLFWENSPPEIYKKVYNYHKFSPTGTWGFIPEKFAPMPRLGWSTDVSANGDIAVFGAPTDSFNEFDDYNVWYEGHNTWASYIHAGAVRVFESRKYYPHNTAVEFYRFGNLDKNTNPGAVGYDDLEYIYESIPGISFRRTQFEENDIPKDAGLAFIITPEIDAASDEVISNIKDWLALGDRTLVLVGNDPEFEENGKYRQSNEIINKILEKLDSRMRIQAARNEYEAVNYNPDTLNDKYNVTKSFVPSYAHSTSIRNPNMYASGVGDIRIHLDGDDVSKPNFYIEAPCDDENVRCNMPLQHGGDLRSQWNAVCGGRVTYQVNWPWHFRNTPNPSTKCESPPLGQINRPFLEPRPILTAAEWIEDQFIPAVPTSGYEETCEGIFKTTVANTRNYFFAENQIDNLEFSISGIAGGQASGLNIISHTLSDRDNYLSFYDPDRFGIRDGFLQGSGDAALKYKPASRKVADQSVLASEEDWYNGGVDTNSKVYLVATVHSENEAVMEGEDIGAEDYDPSNPRSHNNDQNIQFYRNLIRLPNSPCDHPSSVGQLGGWTGRTSFKDAYQYSEISSRIANNESPKIQENFTGDIDNLQVSWIANPTGLPSTSELQEIKNWLNRGDKKLVITYDNKESSARNIIKLCDLLELNTKPFVKDDDSLALQGGEIIKQGNVANLGTFGNKGCYDADFYHKNTAIQKVDRDHLVIKGCDSNVHPCTVLDREGNNKAVNIDIDSVDKLMVGPAYNESFEPAVIKPGEELEHTPYQYYSIDVGERSRRLIYYHDPIYLNYEVPYTNWELEGSAKTKFSVQPGSGYRLYVDYVSENANENVDVHVNCTQNNTIVYDGKVYPISKKRNYSPTIRVRKTSNGDVSTGIIDFKAPSGSSEISVSYFSHRSIDGKNGTKPQPFTPRILNVSGCLLPIEYEIVTHSKTEQVGEKCSGVWVVDPGQDVIVPGHMRPIMTDNTKYCPGFPIVDKECKDKGDQLIEDGPVVAAEEFEHFSPGSNGSERSRIVVLADSSMIQGPNTYRDDTLGSNHVFIKSLYPNQPIANPLNAAGGREFEFTQKLRAPERGSPSKLWAASGLDGSMDLFESSSRPLITLFSDNEDSYNPGDVYRRPNPTSPKEICAAIETFAENIMPTYGFNGGSLSCGDPTVDNTIPIIFTAVESGASTQNVLSKFIKDYREDHIDFNVSFSGYPGDLFGYSVSIHEDKLVVGTPFNAFTGKDPVSWSGIIDSYNAGDIGSGLKLSDNGGAGAAFYYQRTGSGVNAVSERLPWEYKQKLKPDGVNVGLYRGVTLSDIEAIYGDGATSIDSSLIDPYGGITDQFGHAVSIDADFVAIGAPGHDMGTLHHHIYGGSAAFIRKEFNASFDIPQHSFYDLGSSGVRIDQFNNADSGKYVMNNGAVFTFEHSITDWPRRTKEWTFKQKLEPQGYNSREQSSLLMPGGSGSENDFFGRSVSLDRARRGDSDYTLVAGAPRHDYGQSGDPSGDAGAAYTFDAMLREQVPAIPNSGSWIDATVFTDDRDNTNLTLKVNQNTAGSPIEYSVSGIITSNKNGDIFLEASGYDPALRGFVAHRPYVTMVVAELLPGIETTGYMSLIASGRPNVIDSSQSGLAPSGMSLFINGPDSAFVYNNVNLYTSSWNNIQESGLILHSVGTSGVDSSGSMFLYTSGVGIVNSSGINDYNPLNLRIRGF